MLRIVTRRCSRRSHRYRFYGVSEERKGLSCPVVRGSGINPDVLIVDVEFHCVYSRIICCIDIRYPIYLRISSNLQTRITEENKLLYGLTVKFLLHRWIRIKIIDECL